MGGLLSFLRDNAAWLAAGFLLTLTSSYGQTFFISIFAGEIRAEFGLSHGNWGAMYALGTLAAAVMMVWAGALTDRFRVRDLALVILPIFAVACLAMAAVPGAWALPFIIFALRFTGQGMTIHIAIVAMGRWFVATRGKALSIATLGVTIGSAAVPLLFVALMDVVAWRWLWVLAALLVLAAIPVLLMLLHRERTPGADIAANSAVGMDGRQWSRPEMLRHWLFWVIVPVILGPATFSTALFFHQVHVAEIKEISHLAFVALFPAYSLAAVAMMVLSGIAVDRFGTPRLMPFLLLPMGAGFFVLGLTNSLAGAAIGMALLGATMGETATILNAFWAEFYGTRNLGSIKAMASAVMVFGTAVGPVLTGVLIDAGLGFETQMVLIGVYFVVVSGGLAMAMRFATRQLPTAGKVDIIRP